MIEKNDSSPIDVVKTVSKDHNKVRGTALFLEKTQSHGSNVTPTQGAILGGLRRALQDRVGVMPVDVDGVFGAARMAKAVIEVASLGTTTHLDGFLGCIRDAIALYNENDNKTQQSIKPASPPNTSGLYVTRNRGRVVESDTTNSDVIGAQEVTLSQARNAAFAQLKNAMGPDYEGLNNSLDLVDGAEKSDLGVEGLRARGYLSPDYDSVIRGVEIQIGSPEDYVDPNKPKGIVSDFNGSRMYQCPFCVEKFGATRVNSVSGQDEFVGVSLYHMELGRMMCFDCDGEFETGETLLDDRVGAGEGFWDAILNDEEDESDTDVPVGFGPSIIIARS